MSNSILSTTQNVKEQMLNGITQFEIRGTNIFTYNMLKEVSGLTKLKPHVYNGLLAEMLNDHKIIKKYRIVHNHHQIIYDNKSDIPYNQTITLNGEVVIKRLKQSDIETVYCYWHKAPINKRRSETNEIKTI